jgi:hypothetical protein
LAANLQSLKLAGFFDLRLMAAVDPGRFVDMFHLQVKDGLVGVDGTVYAVGLNQMVQIEGCGHDGSPVADKHLRSYQADPWGATTEATFSITIGYGFPESAVFSGGRALRQSDRGGG